MDYVTYSVNPRKNPADKDLPPLFYAQVQTSGSADIDEMAQEIAYACTLTDADVMAVIRALIRQMTKNLKAGKIVRLENFGSFQFQVSGKGSLTEASYSPANIQKVNIQFRPGKFVKESQNVSSLNFRKVEAISRQKEASLED
ncbi:MAG: HU family DNA-binding protein [Phocaeicola sp.]